MKDDVSKLRHLGVKSPKFEEPSVEILDTFPNKFPEKDYVIRFQTDEFTSLCPRTGQPDFASIKITYIADKECIESKSLKIYLYSFRNTGSFMETIMNTILNDLVAACQPREMTVLGVFGVRGGIETQVLASYKKSEE